MPSSAHISLADLAEATGIASDVLAAEVATIQRRAPALMAEWHPPAPPPARAPATAPLRESALAVACARSP